MIREERDVSKFEPRSFFSEKLINAVTFFDGVISLDDAKRMRWCKVVARGIDKEAKPLFRNGGCQLVVSDNPRKTFVELIREYEPFEHPIGRGAVIDYRFTEIGSGTRIGPNCSIGQPGFGYEIIDGEPTHFPHVGRVLIGDNVHIGANVTIDRGTLSDTVIEDGVKIDNLVHIAHNVVVRRNAFVIAGAMLGGSCDIGEDAWIAPHAVIKEGVRIGKRVVVGLGAVVLKDVEDDAVVAGVPARRLGE